MCLQIVSDPNEHIMHVEWKNLRQWTEYARNETKIAYVLCFCSIPVSFIVFSIIKIVCLFKFIH